MKTREEYITELLAAYENGGRTAEMNLKESSVAKTPAEDSDESETYVQSDILKIRRDEA